MRAKLLIISILSVALLLEHGYVFAAQPPQVMVQQRGLLLLEGFWQSVTLGYEYNGREAEQTSSATHRFKQKYTLYTGASILDPHLLNLDLELSLLAEQEEASGNFSSSNSSRNKYRYNLAAIAFDLDPYPLVLRSSLEESHVSNSYAPSYTMTISRNSLLAKHINKTIPVRFYYQHLNSDSSGKARDTSTVTDLIAFNASNNYRNISNTEFNLSWNEQQQSVEKSPTTDSNLVTLTLSNAISLDPMRKYSLGSLLQWQEAEVSGDPQKTISVTETVRAAFGKALHGEGIYHYRSEQTTNSNDLEQEVTENRLNLNISHQLYQSLKTRLEGYISEIRINDGDESLNRVGLWFDYHKRLPGTARLHVNAGVSHQITDRHLSVSQVRRTNTFPRTEPGDHLNLNVDGNATLILVESVTGKSPGDPDQLYTEGIDYDVNFVDGSIDMRIDGGNIPDSGINLEIIYVTEINPSIEYATDVISVSSDLSLREGRYRISASYFREENNLLSESAVDYRLNGVTRTQARFDANYLLNRFTLKYGTYEAGPSQYSYLEGDWRYDRNSSWGNLRIQAKDRYTMYDSGSAESTNTLSMGSSFARKVSAGANMLLSFNYVNTTSDSVSRDSVSVRGSINGRINKLFLTLNGSSTIRITDNQTTRDDMVLFEITRYF